MKQKYIILKLSELPQSNEDRVRAAITRYYSALDRRQNGTTAQIQAFQEIENILGMYWVQGATLNKEVS